MNDPKHFRHVLGRYPTGVCVVTSCTEDGECLGLTVGSFTSLSLEPPLVGFLSDKRSRSWERIARTGRFCVNVLASGQLGHRRRFASREEDKFQGVTHASSPGGLPLLDNALAWIECDIERVIDIGDHLLVVGAVRAMERRGDGSPLVFYGGARCPPKLPRPLKSSRKSLASKRSATTPTPQITCQSTSAITPTLRF